jgi:hypothetical protein
MAINIKNFENMHFLKKIVVCGKSQICDLTQRTSIPKNLRATETAGSCTAIAVGQFVMCGLLDVKNYFLLHLAARPRVTSISG